MVPTPSPDYSHPFMQLEIWVLSGESGRASAGEGRTTPYPYRERPVVVLPIPLAVRRFYAGGGACISLVTT